MRKGKKCKILCVCNHGNVRSAAFARGFKEMNGACTSPDRRYIEKEFIKWEAIAIGVHQSSETTIKMMCEWADIVVDLSDNQKENQDIINKYIDREHKYLRLDLGGDRWGNPFHPDLTNRIEDFKKYIKQHLK